MFFLNILFKILFLLNFLASSTNEENHKDNWLVDILNETYSRDVNSEKKVNTQNDIQKFEVRIKELSMLQINKENITTEAFDPINSGFDISKEKNLFSNTNKENQNNDNYKNNSNENTTDIKKYKEIFNEVIIMRNVIINQRHRPTKLNKIPEYEIDLHFFEKYLFTIEEVILCFNIINNERKLSEEIIKDMNSTLNNIMDKIKQEKIQSELLLYIKNIFWYAKSEYYDNFLKKMIWIRIISEHKIDCNSVVKSSVNVQNLLNKHSLYLYNTFKINEKYTTAISFELTKSKTNKDVLSLCLKTQKFIKNIIKICEKNMEGINSLYICDFKNLIYTVSILKNKNHVDELKKRELFDVVETIFPETIFPETIEIK